MALRAHFMTGLPRFALKEQILNPLFFLRRVPGPKGLGWGLAMTILLATLLMRVVAGISASLF